MRCKTAQEHILRFYDGLLDNNEERLLEKHLEKCVQCRIEMGMMGEAIDIEEECLIEDIPDNFEKAVMQKINTIESNRKKRTGFILAVLYNATLALSIILLTVFTEKIDISVFSSLISGFARLHNLVNNLFVLLQKLNMAILEEYYFVLLGAASLVLTLHRLISNAGTSKGNA